MERIRTSNFRIIEGTKLYRSANPDKMEMEEIKALIDLGVKVIIDFRSPASWENKNPVPRLIDSFYTPFKIKLSGNQANYVEMFPTLDKSQSTGRHLYIDIMDADYAYRMVRQNPWRDQLHLAVKGVGYLLGSQAVMSEIAKRCYQQEGEAMIVSQYKSVIKYAKPKLAKALQILCDANNVPAVICCAVGKDRTGIMAAILQLVCGVARDKVIQDYAKSKEAGAEAIEKTMRPDLVKYGLDETMLTAEPETMDQLLQYIDLEYGNLENYLDNIGFGKSSIELLRSTVQPV